MAAAWVCGCRERTAEGGLLGFTFLCRDGVVMKEGGRDVAVRAKLGKEQKVRRMVRKDSSTHTKPGLSLKLGEHFWV